MTPFLDSAISGESERASEGEKALADEPVD
jgi:hypothetical protein